MSQNKSDLPLNRAYRSRVAWAVLLSVLVAGLAVDLVSKSLAFTYVADAPVELDRRELLADPSKDPIPPHEGVEVLPWNLLDFHLVLNRGAVFGIGPNQRTFFIIFTCLALLLGLFVFGWLTSAKNTMAHVAIGLILAGGLGNLYDRLIIGRVRDFLHMLPDVHLPFGFRWPGNQSGEVFPWIFNVADVMLLCGMALLLIYATRAEPTSQNKDEQTSPPPPSSEQ